MSPSVAIEVFHALVMCLFVITIPLLFWNRWPRVTHHVAVFDLVFIGINRVSHYVLGECVLTRFAREAGGEWNDEWFAVKFCRAVFGMIPTNHQIVVIEQFLILVVVCGIFMAWWRRR